MREAKVGQRWQSPDGASWRVIQATNNFVSFTGPGPLRSVTTEQRAVVEADWTYIDMHPKFSKGTTG